MTSRTVLVATTVINIADFNPQRKSLLITNNSGSTCFVSQNRTNVSTEGTPLLVGDSISYLFIDGDEPQLALYGVCLSGTADLRIVEGVPST